MNHKWIKKDKQNSTCKICGAERLTASGIKIYSRSGIVFQGRPDCIDYQKENLKTID